LKEGMLTNLGIGKSCEVTPHWVRELERLFFLGHHFQIDSQHFSTPMISVQSSAHAGEKEFRQVKLPRSNQLNQSTP
jgi:hypothetical protein